MSQTDQDKSTEEPSGPKWTQVNPGGLRWTQVTQVDPCGLPCLAGKTQQYFWGVFATSKGRTRWAQVI